MTWIVEFTDTFGGQPNYCWAHRFSLEHRLGESRSAVMRRAKRAAGLTGVSGRTYWHGDTFEFRPYGACAILMGRFSDWMTPEEISERYPDAERN
jgi:hypothetical protein